MTTLVKFNPNVNAVGGIMAIPGKVKLNALSVTGRRRVHARGSAEYGVVRSAQAAELGDAVRT